MSCASSKRSFDALTALQECSRHSTTKALRTKAAEAIGSLRPDEAEAGQYVEMTALSCVLHNDVGKGTSCCRDFDLLLNACRPDLRLGSRH
jgi:hypothetical protein